MHADRLSQPSVPVTVRILRLVRSQLHQVPRDEACRQPEGPKQLHQQPRRITARSGLLPQRLFTGLHSVLQPCHVADPVAYPSGQVSHERDGVLRIRWNLRQECFKSRPPRPKVAIRLEIMRQLRRILKRKGLESRIQKERKWIDGAHVRHQRHVHHQLGGLARKDHPRQVIAKRVELPVQDVVGRSQLQRIAGNGCLAVRRRTKLDDLRTERDCPFVAIRRSMMQFQF